MATMDSVTPPPLPKLSRWPGTTMKIAMICSIIALILLATAGPGYRMGVVPLIAALLATAFGFFLFIVAFIGGAIALVSARRTARPIPRGATPLVILAGVVSVFGVAFILHARGAPPIHDITTDFSDPPAFKDVLALRIAAGAQNPPDYHRLQNNRGVEVDVTAAQRSAFPDILPIDASETPAVVLPLAEKAARKMGWTIVAVAPDDGRIEATDTTRYFGFKDDIVVRVRPAATGSRIDVRSESRIGLGDAGTNAHRVSKYLSTLRDMIAGASNPH
jgi:uncharacterized protein (DUF1499 family)